MENKKIAIIALCIVIFVIAGITFNSIFSKADKNNQEVAVKSETVKSSNTKLKTDLETEDKEKTKDEEKEDEVENKSKEETKEEESNDEVENNLGEENDENNQVDINQNNDENTNTSTDLTNQDNSQSNQENNNQVNEQPQPQKQTVTVAISCQTAINNGVNNESGFSHLPSNGTILQTQTVEIEDGDTVFDVLQKVVRDNSIHMEYTGSGSTLYVEGIHNLYEFDGGQNSGWMYSVNGWYPNYGAGVYELKANDVIQWNYTCDLGADLGASKN